MNGSGALRHQAADCIGSHSILTLFRPRRDIQATFGKSQTVKPWISRLGWGKPEFGVVDLHRQLTCTPDMMLPLSWHQREDLWSSNAAMSRAETLHSAQVTPPLYHACLSGITNDETVSSAVKIAVSNETAFWACR